MTPAEQVSRRVCVTAAGYTLGVATPDGPRLFHGRQVVRRREPEPSPPIPRETPERAAPIAMSLLAELERIAPSGALPPLSHLGAAIGLHTPKEQMTSHVSEHIRTLVKRDLIAWWRGSDHGYRGECAIRIVATGRVLRTAGCPARVVP